MLPGTRYGRHKDRTNESHRTKADESVETRTKGKADEGNGAATEE